MENYGLRKSIFYCGKKEFEVINTCFQFFGFIRHLIVVYHLQMRVFVFVISYRCYGWQQESHHFFQRYVFYEKKKQTNKKKKTWTRQNFSLHSKQVSSRVISRKLERESQLSWRTRAEMLATQPSLYSPSPSTVVQSGQNCINDKYWFPIYFLFTAKYGGLSIRTLLNSPDNYGNVCLHLAIKNKEASDR